MLTMDYLRKNCRKEAIAAGEKLLNSGKVMEPSEDSGAEGEYHIHALVKGAFGAPRKVMMDITNGENSEIKTWECGCYDSQHAKGLCQHAIALTLWYMEVMNDAEEEETLPEIQTSEEIKSAFAELPVRVIEPEKRAEAEKETKPSKEDPSRYWRRTTHGLANYMATQQAAVANLTEGVQPKSVHLEPELYLFRDDQDQLNFEISLKIGVSRMFAVRNLIRFVHSVLTGEKVTYGKTFKLTHSVDMFDDNSRQLYQIVERTIRKLYPDINSARDEAETALRQAPISMESLVTILSLYTGQNVQINRKETVVADENPQIRGSMVKSSDQGVNIQIPTIMALSGNEGTWIYSQGAMYKVTDAFLEEAMPFLYAVNAVNVKQSVAIEFLSRLDFEHFCGEVLPKLEKYIIFEERNIHMEEFRPKPAHFEFYLTADKEGVLWMRPVVCYGEEAYPLFVSGNEYRDTMREIPAQELVKQFFDFTDDPEIFCQTSEERIFEFLKEGTNAFMHEGALLYDKTPEKKIGIAKPPKMSVGVKKKNSLIDLSVEAEELSQEELDQLLKACAEKKKFFRLKNGEYLELEDGAFKVISELAEGLGLEGSELTDAEVPLYRAQFIEDVLSEDAEELEVDRSADFGQLIDNLHNYNESGLEVPEGITVTLRPYQEEGFRWLATMADCGLGSILADDMGLGKTLQTITLLAYLQQKALIVCPASLLYNWGKEIAKFAPELTVDLIRGRAAEREDKIANSEAMILVTSYDYLKRDIEKYQDRQFGCMIIDEAQEIRNPSTQAARAVKQVKAEIHIALTGTPIENNLTDLWSIFDYVMPGYLFGQKKFHTEYELPIGNEDDAVLERLRKMVQPFMLRRKKEDVLKELPEKVENIVYVELEDEQRLLYLHEEQMLRDSLKSASDDELKKNKIEFLARLNSLRQYCCDPHLHLEGYEGPAGKVDACIEMLKEAQAGNHHVLVFSQFTSMLEILREKTDELGMKTLYLQGKDSKEARQKMVEQFQTGAYLAFFISLKAGGTGLTLTVADQVIHFDPWWNSAAEDQATGRAHRFGQQNTVFVTKLVAKDTIEERIVEMQEAKRELSDSIISGEGIGSGRMDREALLGLLGQGQQ